MTRVLLGFFALGLCSCGATTETTDGGVDSGAADTATTDTGVAMDTGTDTGVMDDTGVTDTGADVKPPWTPKSLNGIVVWLDGSDHNDSSKVTLDMGGRVAKWKDLSSSNNDATPYPQASPRIRMGVFSNGKDALQFADNNGTNPGLVQITDKQSLEWGMGDFFVAMVMRSFNTPAGQDEYGGYAVLWNKSKGPWPYYGHGMTANVPTGGNQPYLFGGVKSPADLNPPPGAVSTQVINDGTFHRIAMRRTSGTTMTVWVDGQSTVKMSIDNVSSDAAGADLNIGGYHGNVLVNAPLKGDIAEIVAVKGAITDPDVATLDGYFKTKYGL